MTGAVTNDMTKHVLPVHGREKLDECVPKGNGTAKFRCALTHRRNMECCREDKEAGRAVDDISTH